MPKAAEKVEVTPSCFTSEPCAWSWRLSGASSLSQTLTALPNGKYGLSVWAKSGGAGAMLYEKPPSGSALQQAIAVSSTWTQVKLSGITVSGGQAEIGVTGGGQDVNVDDFAFVAE